MKQIVLVGGGNTFDSELDYLVDLTSKKLSLDRMRPFKSWKNSLQDKLGKDYDVLFASMPNTSFARYSEWKVVFDKIGELLNNNSIIIGHSLGGLFLAKYLSENRFPKKVKALILLAAPYSDDIKESLGDFKLKQDVSNLETRVGKIFLIQSVDDPIVGYNEYEKYQRDLPNAQSVLYNDKQHFFSLEEFPELVKLIKSI